MSLILDALRKLEKEKAVPERGFLVVGTSSRPARSGTWVLAALILAGAAAAAIAWKALSPSGATVARNSEASVPHPLPGPPQVVSPQVVSPQVVSPRAAPAVTAVPTGTVLRTPEQSQSTEDGGDAVSRHAVQAPTSKTNTSPEPSPTPAYQLQAISSRDGKPVAILDGRLVHEGDRFGNLLVLRIGDIDIEVEVGGVRKTLRFFSNDQ